MEDNEANGRADDEEDEDEELEEETDDESEEHVSEKIAEREEDSEHGKEISETGRDDTLTALALARDSGRPPGGHKRMLRKKVATTVLKRWL